MVKTVKATRKVVTDRRTPKSSDRRADDRRTKEMPVAVERRQLERRTKVNRRRQIDPTTCERDYTDDELQFMQALETYKRTSGRMFPTCSEVLEVLRGLGYSRSSATVADAKQISPELMANCEDIKGSGHQSDWGSGAHDDMNPV